MRLRSLTAVLAGVVLSFAIAEGKLILQAMNVQLSYES